jgi:hypothetical protein
VQNDLEQSSPVKHPQAKNAQPSSSSSHKTPEIDFTDFESKVLSAVKQQVSEALLARDALKESQFEERRLQALQSMIENESKVHTAQAELIERYHKLLIESGGNDAIKAVSESNEKLRQTLNSLSADSSSPIDLKEILRLQHSLLETTSSENTVEISSNLDDNVLRTFLDDLGIAYPMKILSSGVTLEYLKTLTEEELQKIGFPVTTSKFLVLEFERRAFESHMDERDRRWHILLLRRVLARAAPQANIEGLVDLFERHMEILYKAASAKLKINGTPFFPAMEQWLKQNRPGLQSAAAVACHVFEGFEAEFCEAVCVENMGISASHPLVWVKCLGDSGAFYHCALCGLSQTNPPRRFQHTRLLQGAPLRFSAHFGSLPANPTPNDALGSYRDIIVAKITAVLLKKHAQKMGNIQQLLAQFRNREQDLLAMLNGD